MLVHKGGQINFFFCYFFFFFLGGGGGRGGSGWGGGGQGGCELRSGCVWRSEAFVKIQKKKKIFEGGVGVGGGGGGGGGRVWGG